MTLGVLHVVAAVLALTFGSLVLARLKGDRRHVGLGRLYVAFVLTVNVPVFFLYDASGAPGPFHLLAVVSLATTALGWTSVRRHAPRRGEAVGRHAAFMTWSWIGLATAGLGQLANRLWPESSPWPVIAVVVISTGLGLIFVPRYVARQLDGRRRRRSSAADVTRAAINPRPCAAGRR